MKNFLPEPIRKPEFVPVGAVSRLRSRSLNPGPDILDGCFAGDPESLAIADAWRFRFPVRHVTQAELNAMNVTPAVFGGA